MPPGLPHDIQRRAVGQRPSVPLHQSPHPQSPDRTLFQIDRNAGIQLGLTLKTVPADILQEGDDLARLCHGKVPHLPAARPDREGGQPPVLPQLKADNFPLHLLLPGAGGAHAQAKQAEQQQNPKTFHNIPSFSNTVYHRTAGVSKLFVKNRALFWTTPLLSGILDVYSKIDHTVWNRKGAVLCGSILSSWKKSRRVCPPFCPSRPLCCC